MQLKPEQLASHLENSLSTIYLVGGEESLLVQESVQNIRQKARLEGYEERVVFDAKGLDWADVAAENYVMSLFSQKKIVEIRIDSGKPGREGGRVLQQWCDNPPKDTLLLVICLNWDASSRKSKWKQTLAQTGVYIEIWPVDARQLPQWISQRMKFRGVNADRKAIACLAERVEGNLLAASQEIDKLALLFGSETISDKQIMQSVADSSRFDVFKLIDYLQQSSLPKALRVLRRLRGEAMATPIIVWAFAKEVRLLSQLRFAADNNQPLAPVFKEFRVWSNRQSSLKNLAMARSQTQWNLGVLHCTRLDQMSKGMLGGDIWLEFEEFCRKFIVA